MPTTRTPEAPGLKPIPTRLGAERFLNWKVVAIGFLVGIVLGWFAVRGVDWRQIADSLKDFPWPLAGLALLLQLVAAVFRAYRWRLLFVQERVSTGRLFLVQHVGLGLNNVFPIRVMSEPIQMVLLTLKDKLSGGSVLATMLMDRTLDGITTAAVLWLGIFLVPVLHGMRYAVSGLVVFLAALLVVSLVAPQALKRIPAMRRLPLLRSYTNEIAAMLRTKWRFAAVVALSVAFWATSATGVWIIGRGLGVDLSWIVIVFIVIAVTTFTSYVPSLPAAAGSFEFAMVYLLGAFGLDKELAFSFALLAHLVLFLPAIVIASFQLPREGMSFWNAADVVRKWREANGHGAGDNKPAA